MRSKFITQFVPIIGVVAFMSLNAMAQSTQPATRRGVRAGSWPPIAMPDNPRDKLPFTPSGFNNVDPKLPSLIVAGDSTAQTGGVTARGWAALLVDYFDTSKVNLVNPSIGGRSARSFLYEGRWDKLIENVKPGDYVFIQWGHNDGGDIHDPKFRADLPGDGPATQPVNRDNGVEVVHSFGWYNHKYVKDVRDKKGIPILMSPTQYNLWVSGSFVPKRGDFADVSLAVANEDKVQYLDQTRIITDRFRDMDKSEFPKIYVQDFLHTSTYGANINCQCFIAGLKALGIQPLVDALNEKGQAIPAWKPTDDNWPPPAATRPARGQ